MPHEFPKLRDGDILEPWHFNILYDEARRWRKLRGVPPINVLGANSDGTPTIELTGTPPIFARITGGGGAYAWEEVTIGPGRVLATTGITGSVAQGNPAYERQTGDATLTADGTVYELRRSPNSGEWLFDGKN